MGLKQIQHSRLQRYLEAEAAILKGQSYQLGDRILTRANLAEVRKAIDDLIADDAEVDGEKLHPGRTKRVVFID